MNENNHQKAITGIMKAHDRKLLLKVLFQIVADNPGKVVSACEKVEKANPV